MGTRPWSGPKKQGVRNQRAANLFYNNTLQITYITYPHSFMQKGLGKSKIQELLLLKENGNGSPIRIFP